jgi:hypothetical protein
MNTRFEHPGGRRRTYSGSGGDDESFISSVVSFVRFAVVVVVIGIAVVVYRMWPT